MFVLIVVAFAAMLTSGLAELAMTARDRARAQSAADAAALAGLDGGYIAAMRVAGINGSTLVSWSSDPGSHDVTSVVEVVVEVGGQIARARASDQP